MMDKVILGRTGLEVSVAGLGCGGHSRLGQATGASEAESRAIVKRALDLGITFIDTARVYGTEEIVGKATEGRRDEFVLSTKVQPRTRDNEPRSADALRSSLEKSLKNLRTDVVDVYHLHGVRSDLYGHALSDLVPEMFRLRDEGKIRFIALSEAFGRDTRHSMLQRAVGDDCWDVMMVGFHLLNQSARERIFSATISKDIGVLVMFAVRQLLSHDDQLRDLIKKLISEGRFDQKELDPEDPLAFLVHPEGADSVVDAAYRFTRHEPGTHVILTGTGKLTHLESNVESINKGPLPAEDLERLRSLFGHLDHISGN